ncbi:MAG: hypothetical protein EPO39_11700 [Candidatus Manganitrophaceae bacterium]|nr:MAG: hypothetical protein EPO39_11700 [Candidatus Manganitrophaceae bacterium]
MQTFLLKQNRTPSKPVRPRVAASEIRLRTDPALHLQRTAGNQSALKLLSKAPQPVPTQGAAPSPAPSRPQPGVADLYITVRAPSQITDKEIFDTSPLFAPSSGISFQLSRHATFRQDEYVLGNLRWKPAGSKLSQANQPETFATFNHTWTSHTVLRKDLPGNPILLNDFDTHIYGLAVTPGLTCENAAKKQKPPFDRNKDDWTFDEHGKFVDTVAFPDKEIKRVYFYDFRCIKTGSTVKAQVDYSNVDNVERI